MKYQLSVLIGSLIMGSSLISTAYGAGYSDASSGQLKSQIYEFEAKPLVVDPVKSTIIQNPDGTVTINDISLIETGPGYSLGSGGTNYDVLIRDSLGPAKGVCKLMGFSKFVSDTSIHFVDLDPKEKVGQRFALLSDTGQFEGYLRFSEIEPDAATDVIRTVVCRP